MISKASAPGKIILFGEHFVVYGVKAILASVDKRITVTSKKTDEKKIIIDSLFGNQNYSSDADIESIKPEIQPIAYLAKKMINKFDWTGGIQIKIDSQLPPGVGLGSSSSSCVASAASISGLFEERPREDILELAIDAERTIFPQTSGADCTVCTFGGIIEYQKDKDYEKINAKPDFELVILNSDTIHSTDKMVSQVREFKNTNPEMFLKLCEKETNLIEKAKQALRNNDSANIGRIMKENQSYLEEIGVSNQNLQNIVEFANSKTFGSKLTGAGGGGCIISITNKNDLKTITESFDRAKYKYWTAKLDFDGLIVE
ncbi:MAG: mevalonate kinase [Nitrosopumilaceae archaeon]|nr:mevalonate kinase [Nitrosopumilaceae archaeon]NIU00498.1 mevalonate kinase [Nitrosopumilaceae archaeon]NIU86881.1 mevalonate kinase [Nitrosopumilaceae archaeon]NIV65561.1 mevalonate kinase [Nitrosopumilaceae archaeon]NIX61100.1 mevalonate kinase [Nitrosopumilaceae archaeon]